MTYQAQVSQDGSLPLPETIVRAIGIQPGDRVVVDTDQGSIVVRRDDRADHALDRLRRAMQGYSVDQFLRDRRADWAE